MNDWRKTAERVTKLVALGQSPNEHEAERARAKALQAISAIDLELVETLSGQRDKLIADCRAELDRLHKSSKARPNKGTEHLVSRSQLLLDHYRKLDALPAIVELVRALHPE
jgi:hypothetical protein